MRLLGLWLACAVLTAGCIDFKDGLACSTDADCLGEVCVASVCQATSTSTGTGTGGTGTGGDGGSTGQVDAGNSMGTGGTTQVLASGQTSASSLREDGTALYWLVQESSGLKLRQVLKSGGAVSELANLGSVASGMKPVLAVGNDAVYVAVGPRIVKVPKNGGTPVVLTSAAGSTFGGGIGIAGNTLVWLGLGSSTSVLAMPITGGTVTQVSTDESYSDSLIASSHYAYWTTRSGIFVYDFTAKELSSFPSQGPLLPKGLSLSANGTTVAWVESAPGNYTYLTVAFTLVGGESASTASVSSPNDLDAATSDGSQTLFAIAESKEDNSSTGLFTLNTSSNSSSYVRATGGGSVSGGVASEVQADGNSVYFIVQDEILRRAR